MHISDTFRAVFGDPAMMSRIRPLYEWQYANDNDTARLALTFADRYFNNGDGQAHVVTPYPVSHWLWGGGGATYYGAVNGNGLTSLIADPTFAVPAITQPGYQTNPPGSSWTFSGTAGIAAPGGPTSDIPPAYQGGQMGFITDHGAISIAVTLPTNLTSSIFGVSLKAVNRTKAGSSTPDQESLRVVLDGTNNLTAKTYSQGTGYTVPGGYDASNPWLAVNVSWAHSDYYYTRSFKAAPGETHTITIQGFGNGLNASSTNQTAFLGEVRVTSVDRIFEDGIPGGGDAAGQPVGEAYQATLNTEATWAAAFGLHELSYEGGWSLGGDDGGSWNVIAPATGDYQISAVLTGTNDTGVLLTDDLPVATNGQWTGTVHLVKGLHSLKVRSTSAQPFQVTQVSLFQVGAPASPAGISLMTGDGSVTASWAPVSGATYYEVRYGITPGVFTQVVDAGAATNLTVFGLTNDQEYFFTVLAGNDAGLSLPCPEGGAVPLAADESGTLAIWDFDGAIGDETSALPVAASSQVLVGVLVRGAGLDPSESSWSAQYHLRDNRFASEPDAGVNHQYGTNLAQAVGMNQYYEFTIQPSSGQAVSFSELAFRAYFQAGAGSAGTTYSTDGVTFNSGLLASGSPSDSTTPWRIDLTDQDDLQATTNAITFRIYLFGLSGYQVSGLGDPSGPGIVVLGSFVPLLPTITAEPGNQTTTFGGSAVFSVAASGSAPLGYQWQFNGANLADGGSINGSQNNLLAIIGAAVTEAGSYSVIITNSYGVVTSRAAVLTVLPATPSVTWTNPTPIIYGSALGADQLNAAASVAGVFTYSPTNQSLLFVGTNVLSVVFAPADSADYAAVTSAVSLVVLPAPLTVTAGNANRLYGQPNPIFTGFIAGVTNGDDITCTFVCAATVLSPPGAYPITASLADPDHRLSNYSVTINDGTLTILGLAAPAFQSVLWQADQVILTWSATAGESYQVQYVTNLDQPIWTVLGPPMAATNSTATASDSIGLNQTRFYRVMFISR